MCLTDARTTFINCRLSIRAATGFPSGTALGALGGVQGSRPAGEGSVTSFARMGLFSGRNLFGIAVIIGIAAVMEYRVRAASFKRAVLTGDGGLFEDSVDNSSERCTLSRHL
jgi:hypothetical protein